MNTRQQNELNCVLKKICEIAEKSASGDYIFRGEPEYYEKVSSTLYRDYVKDIEEKSFEIDIVQKEILDEARKYTRETANDLEILTALQHYGGKTNLIDFTTDYLIALFFACDGERDKVGRVILLEKESDDYEVEKPPKTINRVESQKSIFVQASKGFVEPDAVVTVPKELKQSMLNYLRKHHDISTETIYNDLHGFITNRSIHESAYTQFHKGMTCQNRGDSAKTRAEKRKWYDKSVGHYTEALAQKPDMSEAYNNRGIAYNEKGELDNAIADYTTAIELKPDDADAYNNRGVAYGERGDVDNAIQDYNTAIALNSQLADAYNNRGNAYSTKGDFDNAIKDFDTAIALNLNYAEAYNNRGIAYDKKGDFDNALKDFNTAIALNPQFADAYNNRGNAYSTKGDFDTAIQDFNTAIALNPDHAKAYNNRGVAYGIKGDFDTAIADYTTAIALNPNYAHAYCNRGKVWLRLREWDKAKADLTVARDMGADIIASFHNDYESVADFEQQNGVQVPPDITGMLTRQVPLPRSRYKLPILKALEQLNGFAATHVVLKRIRLLMVDELGPKDLECLASGQPYWKNRTHSMRWELVRKGLMKRDSPQGLWEITDAGREYLRNNGDA